MLPISKILLTSGTVTLLTVYLFISQWKLLFPPTHSPGSGRRMVYTYVQTGIPIKGQDRALLTRMLQVWLRSWHAHGYHPIILFLADAMHHSNYTCLRDTFATFPTVNPPEYELACYMRWLAFRMTGGGVFMDYDIVAVDKFEVPWRRIDGLYSWEPLAPMLTVGGADGLDRQIAFMASHGEPLQTIEGRPHTSDMLIMRRNMNLYTQVLFNHPPIVHVSNDFYEQFSKEANVGITRDDLIADISLYGILQTRRIHLLMPRDIQVLYDQCSHGLCVTAKQSANLSRLKVFSHQPPQNRTESISLVSRWPLDMDMEMMFVVFASPSSLASLDQFTQNALRQSMSDGRNIIPLYTEKRLDCQLLLDYHLGYAAKHAINFKIINLDHVGEAKDHQVLFQMLTDKFHSLLKPIQDLESQLVQL